MSYRDAGIVVGAARTERASAIDLVRHWFDAVHQGQSEKAMALMGSPMTISISGGHRFSRFDEFLIFASKRYAGIRKQVEAFEACEAPGGVAVYARGHLSGSWQDGTTFESVRWCDRFLVSQGQITDLQTWSDIAETRLPSVAD